MVKIISGRISINDTVRITGVDRREVGFSILPKREREVLVPWPPVFSNQPWSRTCVLVALKLKVAGRRFWVERGVR